MGVYLYGNGVQITETFGIETTPGDYSTFVPTDPTTVTFALRDSYNTVITYVNGVDIEVTHPSVGVYVLTLTGLTPGQRFYTATGTGAVVAVSQGEFTVLQSAVSPTSVPWPQFGPCQPWISANDIRGSCDTAGCGDAELEEIAARASQIMFEVSGRQFTGNCERTVRPCDTLGNTCWGGSRGWTGWPWAWSWDGVTWGWYDGAGCHCNCRPLSRILLSGYPVTQISEVKIDGVVVPALNNWRLDERRFLTRMADASGNAQLWPACQRLDLDDTESGTWSVTYYSGAAPPLAGQAAATALACELLPGADCKLPSGAVRIVRQGITVDRLTPLADMLRKGATGIAAIDTFIAAYNPSGLRRRPTIYTPSGPRYARSVGS